MTKQHSEIQDEEKQESMINDMTRIKGVGPAISKRFHEANIRTFSQLAATPPVKILPLMSGLTGITVERVESWVEQARQLAGGSTTPGKGPIPEFPNNHQEYATFTVTLLLDEKKHVRRTGVIYIQKKKEQVWPGWEAGQLEAFITQEAGLSLQALSTNADPIQSEPEKGLASQMQIREVIAFSPDTNAPFHLVQHNQPYNIRVSLDLSDIKMKTQKPLACKATVSVKDMASGVKLILGQKHRLLNPGESDILLDGKPLPNGLYRLEGEVNLTSEEGKPGFKMAKTGSFLQVF